MATLRDCERLGRLFFERENEWLRHLVLLPEEKHAKFWRSDRKARESEMAPSPFSIRRCCVPCQLSAVEQKMHSADGGDGQSWAAALRFRGNMAWWPSGPGGKGAFAFGMGIMR